MALQPGANVWPLLLSMTDPAASDHPFWVLDWNELHGPQVLICTMVLTFAGILCSAGGIGGGGVYVTVLMVAGGLSPRDAVPLSKAIVFFGSMSSLVLNMRKSMSRSSSQGLIDYNICRLVVPSALVGTLLGVFLNRITPDQVIVGVLTVILLFMTFMTVRAAYSQYQEEEAKINAKEVDAVSSGAHNSTAGGEAEFGSRAADSRLPGTVEDAVSEATPLLSEIKVEPSFSKPKGMNLLPLDGMMSLGTLMVVIVCGVLRFHAGSCETAVSHGLQPSVLRSCHHPSMRLLGNHLEAWMGNPLDSARLLFLAMAVPIGIGVTVMVHYGWTCVTHHNWRAADVLKYQVMGLSTGCLAGLVGIGGGLIFSPFFLLMGVDPAIAVATSSTCVIFTSSSTTLQYLLTDRIMLSLTIVYGLVNLCASYVGTSFVHLLQDSFAARKSYITSIVAVGVLVSAALSVIKMFDNEAGPVH